MTARIFDSAFHLPDLTAAPRDLDARSLPHQDPHRLYDAAHPAGALRGLAFALAIEFGVVLVGFSGWNLWRLLR